MKEVDDWNEENEETIYSDAGRENLLDDGELTAEEDAFMQGYSDAEEELE